MSVAWNDILQLPPATLAGDRRVPKTQIAKQARLVKASRNPEAMLDRLRDIKLFATLTKSNSHIPPVRDDTYDIESILFLTCGLKTTKGLADAVHMVHTCFPNPTVILVEGLSAQEVAISAAVRRKSLADHGAFVTERETASGLFTRTEKMYQPYLERIGFRQMPQTTLLAYVSAMADRCQAANAVKTLGYYPRCKDEDVESLMAQVKQLHSLETQIKELRESRRSKDITLANSTKIRIEIRNLETKRNGLINQIKELCV